MGAVQTGKKVLRGLLLCLAAYVLLVASWMGLSLVLKPAYFAFLGIPFDTLKMTAGGLVALVFGLAMRPAMAIRLSNVAALAAGLTVGIIAVNLGNPTPVGIAVGSIICLNCMAGGMIGALIVLVLHVGHAVVNRVRSGKDEPPKPG